MFLMENIIVDFPMNPIIQAEVIECFRGEKEDILFSFIEPNEEDLKEEDIKWAENPWIGIKEPVFVKDEQQRWTDEVIINKSYYYKVESYDELLQLINDAGCLFDFFIFNKEWNEDECKYWLHTYENLIIDREEQEEHRVLFFEGEGNESFKEDILPRLEKVIEKYKDAKVWKFE